MEINKKLENISVNLKKKQINKVAVFAIAKIAWAIFRALLFIGIGYVVFLPIFTMLSKAFSGDYLGSSITVWIPQKFTTYNFVGAFKYLKYSASLMNTIKLSVVSSILCIISCSLAGYGFARYKFWGRELLFSLVIFTIIVPSQTYIISSYLNFKFFNFFGIGSLLSAVFGINGTVNLINTFWTFWLPSLFGMGIRSGLYIYIFRQFFRGLPKDLEEAAKIDGCGAFKTYVRIMVPNASSAYLTVFLFSLVWHWNEYFVSNMMFQVKNEPLSVVAFRLMDFLRNQSSMDLLYMNQTFMLNASAFMIIIPLVVVFIVAQRYFIESMDKVGIKG